MIAPFVALQHPPYREQGLSFIYLSCDFDILIRGSGVERAHGSRVDRVWRALDRVPPTSPTNRCGSHQGADQRALREAPLIPPL